MPRIRAGRPAGRPARRRRAPGPARPVRPGVSRVRQNRSRQAQRRRGVGRAAADPGGDRQPLVQRQRAHRRRRPPRPRVPAPRAARGCPRRRQAPAPSARRPRASSRGPGASAQLVGEVGEDDKAVEQVVAVRAAAGDQEVEVELGRRPLGETGCSAAVAAPHRAGRSRAWPGSCRQARPRARRSAPAATGSAPRAAARPANRRRPDGR